MYRPSLGTRGETRRAAAEAETALLGRVRPWKRKADQACPLAPHVRVPLWVRAADPPTSPVKAVAVAEAAAAAERERLQEEQPPKPAGDIGQVDRDAGVERADAGGGTPVEAAAEKMPLSGAAEETVGVNGAVGVGAEPSTAEAIATAKVVESEGLAADAAEDDAQLVAASKAPEGAVPIPERNEVGDLDETAPADTVIMTPTMGDDREISKDVAKDPNVDVGERVAKDAGKNASEELGKDAIEKTGAVVGIDASEDVPLGHLPKHQYQRRLAMDVSKDVGEGAAMDTAVDVTEEEGEPKDKTEEGGTRGPTDACGFTEEAVSAPTDEIDVNPGEELPLPDSHQFHQPLEGAPRDGDGDGDGDGDEVMTDAASKTKDAIVPLPVVVEGSEKAGAASKGTNAIGFCTPAIQVAGEEGVTAKDLSKSVSDPQAAVHVSSDKKEL